MVIANLMPILIFSTGANQTSQPQSPVAKPVAFDIVLGRNDSEKSSPLMPNRPPRRLKVGFPHFSSVLFVYLRSISFRLKVIWLNTVG